MRARELSERIGRAATVRPWLTLAVVAALALAGGVGALGLRPDTSDSTFVKSSSAEFRATDDWHRHFGDDSVVILIRESLPNLVQTADLGRLSQLEACLAGEVVVADTKLRSFVPAPAGSKPPYGGWSSPCGHLMRTHPAQVVYGPATFLNRAVAAVNQQVTTLFSGAQTSVQQAEVAAGELAIQRGYSKAQALKVAQAAGTLAQQQQTQQLMRLALQSGITSLPSIDDPQFIPKVVYDPLRGVNQPKARFSYLFPTADSALIQVRLKAGISDAERSRALGWIRGAVAMPIFRSAYGGTYTVSGAPVVLHDLSSEVSGSIILLLIAAIIVMALTLLAVFRSRPRLLPLALALVACGITFGVMRVVGASLTLASIAVLPVLIGLAVDYAVQFQSGASSAGTIAVAAAAAAAGFFVLLLSPVPMVEGFGVLLVVGIAVAFACALTAGTAAIALRDRHAARRERRAAGGDPAVGAARPARARSARVRVPAGFVAAWRGAGEILGETGRRVTGPARRAGPTPERMQGVIARVIRRPGRVLAAAAAIAALGWVVDTQTAVESDISKLVPSSMPALRDLRTLERVTGVSGEIDVTVRAPDVTRPRVISWMLAYETNLLKHFGYLETKGCQAATLCPALSLPDLFAGAPGSGSVDATNQGTLTKESIDALLAAVPPYFSQAVITPDRREATLAFGIRLMPLARQSQVIGYMRAQLRHPPPGVTAQPVGLQVLAAKADADLSSAPRRLLTMLAGLLAVGLLLRLLLRRTDRALVPLIPIALATGWSSLLLFVSRVPLNPMSATLGALVIAISTEFSVLLSERYRRERAAGHDQGTALTRTYASTGTAVLASGITAIAGFGVLVASNITMLRNFGFVTVLDLGVSLAGVLLVLPAVLVLAERDDLREAVLRRSPRVAGGLRADRRPAAPVA